MWRDKIKDWFFFSESLRKGIVVVCSLILFVIVIKFLMPYFTDPGSTSPVLSENEIEAWLASVEADSTKVQNFSTLEFATGNFKATKLFTFNPNLISTQQWMDLGFSEKQVRSIDKYRSNGGTFRVKSDLKKLYVISQEKYLELYPFIDLPDSVVYETDRNFKPHDLTNTELYNTRPALLVDLNLADTVELKKLRGIGSYFANSIVKFRDALGGFHNIDQLYEVYNMKAATVDSIRINLLLGNYPLRKMNINKSTYDELNAHPYLSSAQAKTIVAYREQHGLFASIVDLKKVVLVDEQTFIKIEPYIIAE